MRQSHRAVQALALAAAGTPNGEIAVRLGTSEDMAKKFIQRACRALGAANRVQAVVLALVRGVLVLDAGGVGRGPTSLRDARRVVSS
ncbi:LuxR C-terminal-related transcriptional regulator [Pseudonocardia kongjuensis]